MIRLALPSDVEEIARVHVKTWQSAYRGQIPDADLDTLDPSARAATWSRAIAQPGTLVLVATLEASLVGFCSSLPSRDADATPNVGEIAAIYVDPAFWRSGFGSALVEATVASARQRNFSELTLWVLTGNGPARAFYEARGFETDGYTKTDERAGFAILETRYRRRLMAKPEA
jgi:ribosomal protein S18 acetylase RimI-like enzyme